MTTKKEPEPTKFCKDCKWVKYQIEGDCIYFHTYAYVGSCSHPNTIKSHEDLVNGRSTIIYDNNPKELRQNPGACGPTAKWFEEKGRPIPLCKDCKSHFVYMGVLDFCSSGNLPKSIVDGNAYKYMCSIVRTPKSMCGKYGQWFEKKEVSLIEYTTKAKERLANQPNERSWLCRLICGKKG